MQPYNGINYLRFRRAGCLAMPTRMFNEASIARANRECFRSVRCVSDLKGRSPKPSYSMPHQQLKLNEQALYRAVLCCAIYCGELPYIIIRITHTLRWIFRGGVLQKSLIPFRAPVPFFGGQTAQLSSSLSPKTGLQSWKGSGAHTTIVYTQPLYTHNHCVNTTLVYAQPLYTHNLCIHIHCILVYTTLVYPQPLYTRNHCTHNHCAHNHCKHTTII